jgi:hypothetical protein
MHFKRFASWGWENFPRIALLAGLAGFLGMLFAAITYAIVARARLWFVNARATDQFYKHADRINPLDDTFRNRRINISDLVPPFASVIRRKTFIDCELIGPANASLSATSPGAGSMNGVGFIDCNACKVKDDIFVSTGVMFEDCTFLRGRIFRVTFFIPASGYDHMKNSMPGMNWLTLD